MPKLTLLSQKTNDSKHSSPERTLEKALEDLKTGKIEGRKFVLIFLDDKSERYNVEIRMSGLSSIEKVCLLEAVKVNVISEMGYT